MNGYKVWISRARGNMEIAKGIKKTENIFYEDLCNQAHQTIEKALKGL